MKRIFYLLFILVPILLSSCVNTDVFVSDYTLRNDITVDEKLQALGGTKLSVNEPVAFYDSTAWLDELMRLTEESEDYILMSTFLGSSSSVLEPFYELLCQKAESGVDVYMIIDGVSSFDMTESRYHMTQLYFLKDRGVHLIEYSPVTAMHIIAPQELLVRDHRKLFVFDGKKAAIGGMNLNFISLGNGDKNQRDSMYLFESAELAEALTDEFVAIWNEVSVEKVSRSSFAVYEDEVKGSLDAYLFNQGPGGDASVASLYATLINSAEEKIEMICLLPSLNDDMDQALLTAKNRGVDITMLISVEDRKLIQTGVAYQLPDLVAGTSELYSADLSNPLIHEKLMIVDGRYTVIGSANFNYRSMGLSNEISLMIDSPEFAEKTSAHFHELLADKTELLTMEKAEEMKKDLGSWLSYIMIFIGG